MSNQLDAVQLDDLDSGPATLAACLPALLAALGWKGDPSSLAEYMPPPGKDLTLAQVTGRMELLGYRIHRQGGRDRPAAKLVVPGLLEHADGSFSCLVGRESDGFLVYSGIRSAYEHVAPDWPDQTGQKGGYTGFGKIAEQASAKVGMYWIQNILAENRGILGIALGFSFILALFGVLTPQFMSLLYREIDSMIEPGNLVVLGLGVLLFVGGELAFSVMRQVLMHYLGEKLADVLGRETLRRILYFPWSLGMTAGSRAQWARVQDFEGLASQFGRPMAGALLDLPFMLLLIVALGYMSGTLVLIPLVALVVFGLLAVFAYPLMRKMDQEAAAAGAVAQSRLDAAVELGTGIRRWGLGRFWKESVEAAELEVVPLRLRKNRLSGTFYHLSQALVSLAGLTAVCTGAGEVMAGHLSQSVLLAAMMLVWRILDPLRSLFVYLGTIQTLVQNGSRLQKFMGIAGERQPDPRLHPLRLESRSIRVDGLYYRYPQSNRFALANLGFNLPQDQCLVVEGPAGAGKTTLCLVLTGLLPVNNGRIWVGDQNLQQYSQVCLRKKIAYLPARVPVLPLSIRDNLRLARADATDHELLAAMERAGALEGLQALPRGLDTLMDHGFELPSPDFVQCLGLARLHVRNAGIWLLDEPTQGLVPANRAKFIEQLRELKGRATILLLGNDPGYLDLADQLAVLEQGRLRIMGPKSGKEG